MRVSRLFRVIPQNPWISDVANFYLLDTSTLSNLVRQPKAVVAEKIAVGAHDMLIGAHARALRRGVRDR